MLKRGPGSSGGGGGGSGTLTTVTDGTHTVTSAGTLDFTAGAVVTDAGGGLANVAIQTLPAMWLGWGSGQAVAAATYTVDSHAVSARTYTTLYADIGDGGGTITLSVLNNGTAMTGGSAVAVNANGQTISLTGKNTVAAGNTSGFTVAIAAGAPTGSTFKVV